RPPVRSGDSTVRARPDHDSRPATGGIPVTCSWQRVRIPVLVVGAVAVPGPTARFASPGTHSRLCRDADGGGVSYGARGHGENEGDEARCPKPNRGAEGPGN